MSASQNKRELQGQQKKSTRNRVIGIICTILVVALIAGSFLINSNYFYTKTSAVSIGDTDYTVAEFDYFYYTAYNTFYNSLGDYASMIIDRTKPLKDQYYSEGLSFDAYFKDSAIHTMTQVTAIYDAAIAQGKTLSEDGAAQIQQELSMVELYASLNGATADAYIANIYGKSFNMTTYEKLLNIAYIASEYSQELVDSYEYTEDEKKAEYAENKDDYDIYDYRVFYIANGDDAEAAYATADEIARAKTGDEFAQLVYENASEASKPSYEENEATLYKSEGSSLTSYDYGEWLRDSARKANDTEVFESTSGEGYYVVMFVARDDNDYNTANVRHILIKAVAEDGVMTAQSKADARAKINEILEEYESGAMTEERFAELAEQYSEDTGSNTNGGLYENLAHGQTVSEFDEFCFDTHEMGDTGIAFNESDSYTGYHLIYYIGEGEVYSDYIADLYLRRAEYTEWENAETAKYTAEKHFSFRFAG